MIVRPRSTSARLLPLPQVRRQICTRRYASQRSNVSLVPHITDSEVTAARTHCSNLLQRADSPSYTLQAFIPPAARDGYLAIRAFNVDVAAIADTTSHAAVGALRIQFWRDALARALSPTPTTPPREPVAMLLAHAAADLRARTGGARGLPRTWLLNVLGARETRLADPPYADLAALEAYAESTYSSLLYATLAALPLASVTADHVASHLGKAAGIAAVLRGLPLVAFPNPTPSSAAAPGGLNATSQRQGAVLLPLDVMAAHGVREEDVLRSGAAAPGLRDAVFAVATHANDHLLTARAILRDVRAGRDADHAFEHRDDEGRAYSEGEVAEAARPDARREEVERAFGVFLPAVATGMWLQRLEGADFDVFDPRLRVRDWRLPFKAYWAFTRRKI